ncbi:hypothetical protein [Pseudonocardia pini]|uniref:hypothetical protein n=1 Tax=Pseudonocardia pini TaxID=2758030 RepID=UPI0015F05B1B|nr:hypothetical protein [Pseudonocardia pini]
MTADETGRKQPDTREMFLRYLLDKVREDPYPSLQHLDMIEESLTPDLVPEYIQVLIDKSKESEFPSGEVLARMQRLAG